MYTDWGSFFQSKLCIVIFAQLILADNHVSIHRSSMGFFAVVPGSFTLLIISCSLDSFMNWQDSAAVSSEYLKQIVSRCAEKESFSQPLASTFHLALLCETNEAGSSYCRFSFKSQVFLELLPKIRNLNWLIFLPILDSFSPQYFQALLVINIFWNRFVSSL